MMLMNNLKGFNEQEIVNLYKYLCIYENKIKILQNSTDIYSTYPQLKSLDGILKLFTMNYANDKAMQVLGVIVPKGVLYCTNTKNSKIYNFLYHLRNSIAHGQIEKNNEYVFLMDYKYKYDKSNKNVKKIFSGRGTLESSKVFKMVELINNAVEL